MIENFVIQESFFIYFWLSIALVFLLLEIATPGLFFFLAFALGAACGAIGAYLGVSLMAQCLITLGGFAVSFVVLKQLFAKKGAGELHAKTNIDALVGKVGLVTKALPSHGSGYVSLGGESWSARSHYAKAIEVGSTVRVVRVQGNNLIVELFVEK